MVTTVEHDLDDITPGDTFTRDVTFTDQNDAAIDISGWTVFVTVKDDHRDDDGDALIKKDVTSHDDPANGETSFEFSSSDTDGLSGSKYWDLQIKKSGGDVHTILAGRVTFVAEHDVSHRTS